jgi:WD40 repeat protein
VHELNGSDLALTDVCPSWAGDLDKPAFDDGCHAPPGVPWRDQVWTIAFSADGSRFAMAGYAGMLSVWEARTGVRLQSTMVHPDGHDHGWRLAFAPDGATLALLTLNGQLIIYDAATLAQQRVLETASGEDGRLAFSRDGSLLAVASAVDQTRLFATDHWALVHELPVRSSDVDFSSDGGRLLTADADGFVRLWDAATGRELHRLSGAGQGYARFLADERHIATFDHSSLRIMTIDVDELLEIARQRLTRSFTQAECEKYDVCETP